MNDQTAAVPPTRVECPAAKDPSVRLLIMGLIAVGFGLYCAYDLWHLGKYQGEGEYYKYLFNLAGAVILTPIGLVCVARAVFMLRRVLIADEQGIGYAGKAKETIAWSQVKRLVMAEKGLLHLHYDRDGADRVLKLDSWKLTHYAELIALIEAKTPDVPIE